MCTGDELLFGQNLLLGVEVPQQVTSAEQILSQYFFDELQKEF